MDFGVCIVLQGHEELEPTGDDDVQGTPFHQGPGDGLWRAVVGGIGLTEIPPVVQ